MTAGPTKAIKIFFCYEPDSEEDNKLRDELEHHLAALKSSWHIFFLDERNVQPGVERKQKVDELLNEANIILLLLSADFIFSEDCMREMDRALERQRNGEVQVIPIILRSLSWQDTPIGKLQVLPTNENPIASWDDQDEAFENVTRGVRKALQTATPPSRLLPQESVPSVLPRPGLSGGRISRRTVLKSLAVGGATVALAGGAGLAWWELTPHPRLTYGGHTGYVWSVAWSPDGKRIASGSVDRTVQVWEAGTGNPIYTYRKHFLSVFSVAWSREGTHILSGSGDMTAQIWEASTGNRLHIYRGHRDYIRAVAWSPDNSMIVSGSNDFTVRVWDVSSERVIHTFEHGNLVNAVVWSPDGKYIASASNDKTVRVWEVATGKNLYTYHGHNDSVDAVAWSSDGFTIASASHDNTVQVWFAQDGSNVHIYRGHHDSVNAVAWSPVDDALIASVSDDHTAQVWRYYDVSTLQTYTESSLVLTVDWSFDGKYLALGGFDTTVQIWPYSMKKT